jgi:hypothetical protein
MAPIAAVLLALAVAPCACWYSIHPCGNVLAATCLGAVPVHHAKPIRATQGHLASGVEGSNDESIYETAALPTPACGMLFASHLHGLGVLVSGALMC